MENKNIDYIFQIQDDQFGINNKINLENLDNIDTIFTYIEKIKPDYFNMLSNHGDKSVNKVPVHEELIIDNVEYYKYYSTEFNYCYSFNDGTYIASIKLLKKLFFLPNLASDIWQIESYLSQYFKQNKFIRWGMNKVMFGHLNIHGRNIMLEHERREELRKYFMDLNGWNPDIEEHILNLM